MFDVAINYWAVLVAGASSMLVGSIWYARSVFGKAWMGFVGKTEEQIKQEGNPAKSMSFAFILSLVVAYVLAHVLGYVEVTTLADGLLTGFWMWLGFVFATIGTNYLFEFKKFGHFAITSGYHLVQLLVMGAILAVWQ